MGDKRNGATAEEILCEGVAKAGLLTSIVGPREMKCASVNFKLDVALASDGESWFPPKENWFKTFRTTGRSWDFDEVDTYVPYSTRPSCFWTR